MERQEADMLGKELDRQMNILGMRLRNDAYERPFSISFGRFADGLEKLETGQIEDGLVEAATARLEAEGLTQDIGGNVNVFRDGVNFDRTDKATSNIARLLALDAKIAAARGELKEHWISEVLCGHIDDECVQLECLKAIVSLWTEGPWPWH